MIKQDIWKLEKHCVWSGIVYSDLKWHNIWRLLHWKQKEQVRLLKSIWTVCYLANFVYSLFNWEKVQMVSTGVLVPTLFH